MIHLDDLLQATGGTLHGAAQAAEFISFAFDSRRLEPGQLFLAVKTATGDGHDFIGDAIERGAAGVLCEYPAVLPDPIEPVTTIIVPDI
jgi:UDP-N-acetylmuramyl pentapeptide synthase